MKATHTPFIVVAIVVAGASALLGQSAGPAPATTSATAAYAADWFNALKWRSIGPNRGGRSIAASGSPSRRDEYYFGATGGGLWKTVDGGTTWKPVTDNQIRSSSVGAVAVSETQPDTVYIGMGEVALRGNIMQGDGVYKTTDGGKTWAHAGLENSQVVSRLRTHPANPDIVYAAVFGHPAGPNGERGVFRSRDGARTWQRVLFRDAKTGAVDLVIDRNRPDTLYAAMWEAYRISWQMSSGGPGSGLFKSTDGGDTWTELTRNPGLPSGVIGKIGVSVSAVDSNRVYAMVENADGGLFRSDDAGATWTRVSDDRRLRQRAFYYSRVYADTKDKDTVYVLNVAFHKSTDGGKTFKTIRVPHSDNHDLWIDPGNPLRMVNANDGGGTVTVNGGESWTGLAFPTAQLYHVATTKDVPYHVCGAQQDNTTLCVPSDAGRQFRDPGQRPGDWLYSVGGGESGYIAPDPRDPDMFFAGSQGALLTSYNRRTGEVRDVQVYPRFFSGEPASALKERWQWTFPIVFDPLDSNTLFTSSQHVWRTTNNGQSWDRISPDLTRADPKTLGDSGGPITRDMNGPEVFATVFTLAPSKKERGAIWAGSDDGLVHLTRDGGSNWHNVTPPDLPEFTRISIIEASAHDAGAAYLCGKRYLLDDRKPYLYKTRDYGKTWTTIVTGIREDDYCHTIREDPARPGLLYAGTEHGVWVSFDAGAGWQSLSLNLPDTQASDLVVEQNDLVVGTHGRSIYVLDDHAPLRQLTAAIAAKPVHLFTPRTAVRSLSPTPFYYYLAKPADELTIEVLDSAGAVVRTFTNTAEAEKKKPEGTGEADDEGGGPPRVPPPGIKAGLNKFTWDLRHPGATVFEGMVLWSARAENGPMAVPGEYRVRLTANGVVATEAFSVVRDPRLASVTDADLTAQFELALAVRDRTSEANRAVMRIREYKAAIDERKKLARSPAFPLAGDATAQKLTAIEEALYQVRNRSNQDPLNFPIKLNNRLASLRRSIETGDGRPTDGAYVVYKELSAELRLELDRLAAVEKNDLAALNRMAAGMGLAPIAAKTEVNP